MPNYAKVQRVTHTPEQMFDLVADVERYPEFLPLCESLVILSRREREGRELLIARMGVGYKSIKQSFTTQVMLNPADLAIDVKYIDGPFHHLDNRWRFLEAAQNECDVHFDIDYSFKSRALGMLMGSMFDTAFKKFTTAFKERADTIYA
ncbi:MAG: type II toxin-antitoxin system RatA family toxin [Rhizobiaceae bacterium]